MGRLDDRVAIVTGGAGYLGKSHSLHLAREGARVVVADIADGTSTVSAIKEEGGDAIWVRTDVTDEESTKGMAQAALEQYGRIDILINKRGPHWGEAQALHRDQPGGVEAQLGRDLTGMFLCAQAVAPAMKEAGYGRHDQHLVVPGVGGRRESARLRERKGGRDWAHAGVGDGAGGLWRYGELCAAGAVRPGRWTRRAPLAGRARRSGGRCRR